MPNCSFIIIKVGVISVALKASLKAVEDEKDELDGNGRKILGLGLFDDFGFEK